MLYVNGIFNKIKKEGIVIFILFYLILFKDCVIKILIIINVGVVICEVIIVNKGENSKLKINKILVVIVVIFEWLFIVIFVDDLIYVLIGDVFNRELVNIVVELVVKVFFICGILLFFIKFVWLVKFINVLVVLKNVINRNVKIMIYIWIVLIFFICFNVIKNVGFKFGVFEIILLGIGIMFVVKLIIVEIVILIKILFGIWWINKIVVMIKLIMVIYVELIFKGFKLISVVLLVIIKLFWFKLRKVINNLILFEMVNFKFVGIVLIISLCNLKIVIKININEVIKMFVNVVC